MMRPLLILCMSTSMAVAGADRPNAAKGDAGAQLAATCAACHRLDGRDAGIPSIVGLNAEKLRLMMQAFKSNERSNHLMHAVSRSLSDQEIATVAHYLATQGKDTKQP